MPPASAGFDSRCVSPRFDELPLTGGWALIRGVLSAAREQVRLLLAFTVVIVFLDLSGPLLIHKLVTYVGGAVEGKESFATGISVAVALCFVSTSVLFVIQHYFFAALSGVQMIVNGLNQRIYRQALHLTRDAQQRIPTGDVVNFMGTDADAVGEIIFTGTEAVAAGLRIAGATAMLFYFLGPAAIAALVILAVLSPLTKYVGSRFSKIDDAMMRYRDERVSIVSQVLSGIRIVKYFAWVDKMLEQIGKIRDREVKARRRLAFATSLAVLLYIGVGTIVCVATFSTYIALGHKLDAPTIFSCIALFTLLEGPFGHLTELISNFANAKVSGARIAAFLSEKAVTLRAEAASEVGVAVGVVFDGATVQHESAQRPVLHGVNVAIAAGQSVAVVGSVGSGKSSLLLAILNEIACVEGSVRIVGQTPGTWPRIAYVPQEAFVQNGTLRDNILFGEPEGRLSQAVFGAHLEIDVALLPAGLDTEIGEHGINLSGGQKQRVGLARAVAADPGLVLLDDPLSAVDFKTEDTLVERLIFGLWSRRTRIVVTHRLNHLSRFDRILFLEDGVVLGDGTLSELLATQPRFAAFMKENSHAVTARPPSEKSASSWEGAEAAAESHPALGTADKPNGRITDEEDQESGAVKGSVYLDYLRAMGGSSSWARKCIVPALVLVTLTVTILPILQNAWLSAWTDAGAERPGEITRSLAPWLKQFVGSDSWNVQVYGMLGGVVLLFFLGRHLFWALRAVAAGKLLHDEALKGVLRTRVRFFDATPVGRILNRFSRDIDGVERELAWSVEQTMRAGFATIGSVCVMLMVLPALAVVIVPVIFVYVRLQRDYRASSREAQRLFSVSRSPRFAHFKETLTGLTVIRAYRKTAMFAGRYQEVLGENQRMFHALVIFNRWFSIRIPLLGGAVSLGVTIGIIILARHGAILAGTAGLALIYALRFWENLNWSVRSFSQVEAKMTAVERLARFATLEPEPSVTLMPPLLEKTPWPVAAGLRFENVTAKYTQHGPEVLRGVSFAVEGGSKVGFVGRTGAGKTTIFQVLYRFIEVSSGSVTLDGVDIRSVPLDRLRRSIAIIPQDPTLFRGTLRENLDRFGQHSDAAVWRSLARVRLDRFVRSLPGGLAVEVKENGHNFSQGQRQLFCMARALLLDARMIVMDEATASVDIETDALIQETIRSEFVGRTLLIIAHRLETVRDCDLVLEFSAGRVVRVIKQGSLKAGRMSLERDATSPLIG